jgi:hypothetical protein
VGVGGAAGVGLDGALRGVDGALRGVDRALRGVDRALRGVDGALRGRRWGAARASLERFCHLTVRTLHWPG